MFEALLVAGIMAAPKNPTIELLEPKPTQETVEVVKPLELTLEEKIKTNYFKCDESTQYIRADNAECLAKPVVVAPSTQTTVKTPVRGSKPTKSTGSGWYYAGQCTGYVAGRRYVPDGWGNATDWKWHAQAEGWTVSSVPVAGAIGWTYGHVVFVESVNGDTVVISEQNYDWNGSIRTITVPVGKYTYLY